MFYDTPDILVIGFAVIFTALAITVPS